MTYSQEGYRFRNDDQGEMGASWLDTQDAPQIMSWRGAVYEPVGFGAFTPRRAGINVTTGTTPLFIAAHIRPFALRTETIISRFDAIPQRSCYFLIRSDGALMFGYSQDGTAVVDISSTVAWNSPVHSYPIKLGQSFWIGVVHFPAFDVVRETIFYVAPTRETLLSHQLGTVVDFGANGTIYDSNASWYLTLRIDGGFHFSGDIYSVEAYAGYNFDGVPLLNPNFADPTQGWRPGMSGEFSPMWGKDDVGNVWTLSWHHVVAGGRRKTDPFRLRTLSNVTGTPSSSYAAAVASLAPRAHWRFSGVGTADSASPGPHTLTFGGGPTLGVAGVWAGDEAVYFDGVDDFATIASETDLELVSNMSIEMWFRPHTAAGTGECILSCRASGDPLYEITYSPDGNSLSFYPFSGAGSGMGIGTVAAVENQWHHLVVTINWIGSERNIRTYFNGALRSQGTTAYLPAPVSPAISIGRRSIANDLHFDGDISELVIYPSVLQEAQVAEHYAAGMTLMYKRVDEPDSEWREV